jgi:signal transduction histidine kinase
MPKQDCVTRFRAWHGVLACGLLGSAAYYLLPGIRPVVWLVLAFGSATAVLVGMRRNRPTVRLPWYLLAAGMASFAFGDVIEYTLPTPLSDLSSVFFLSTYVALTVALLRLVRARSRGRDVPALLDALVFTTGCAVLVWQFLMVPYARDPALSISEKLTSLAFPLADLMLLAVLLRLWSGGGQRGASYYLLGTAVAGELLSDVAAGFATLSGGSYAPGGPIELGYLALWVAAAAAAIHPSMTGIALPGAQTEARLTERRMVLLGATASLALGVLGFERARGHPVDTPVLVGGGILMFLLVVFRTRGLVREITIRDERVRTVGRVMNAGEEERTRLAADLHDGPVQQLVALSLKAHLARKRLVGQEPERAEGLMEDIEKGLEEEARALRRVMQALRPPALDNRGLKEALVLHVKEFEQSAHVIGDVDVVLEERLAPELETVLYRIVQESLSNVGKHAQAQHVSVTAAEAEDGLIHLRIHDDGVGFDTSRKAELLREGHFGLAGMGERVRMVGGSLEVHSTLGEGTTIEVALPPQLRSTTEID